METKLNVTKGEVQIIEHSWSDTSIMVGDKTVCSISIYDEADEDTQEALEIEASANANLIADALNTHNTTGYTPSQLLEQKRELVEALEGLPDLLIEASDLVELIDPPRNGSSVHSPKLLSTAKYVNELLTKHSKDV